MDFSAIKSITIPEGKVTKIEVGGVTIWKAGYKNWVLYSTEEDGKTIYNGGKGYKDGYRVRSSGVEAAQSDTTITGYIPYVKGDKLYIYPPFVGKNNQNTVTFFDSAFTCLGHITDAGSVYGSVTTAFKTKVVNGVSVLDLSAVTVAVASRVAYVRIGNFITGSSIIKSGSEMIITKNEDLKV